MPVTRTSLPGGAVVAVVKRCVASRLSAAPASSTRRSTAGRQVEVRTVGMANTPMRSSTGSTDARSTTVMPSRRRKPRVENTDMYMWSSTKTWSRSTDRRSSSSGRSWWAMVTTDACRCATCDSSAIVTLSRNRRWIRVDTVRRNHVATADTQRPKAARRTSASSPSTTPSPSSASQSARSASGSAASSADTRANAMSRGSCWYPSLHRRHIERSAGGSPPVAAGSAERIEEPPPPRPRPRSAVPAGRTSCGSDHPRPSSSSCGPSSTTRPCSRTQMRSACRTVENRCEMRIVVQCRVAASTRWKISASPRTSS